MPRRGNSVPSRRRPNISMLGIELGGPEPRAGGAAALLGSRRACHAARAAGSRSGGRSPGGGIAEHMLGAAVEQFNPAVAIGGDDQPPARSSRIEARRSSETCRARSAVSGAARAQLRSRRRGSPIPRRPAGSRTGSRRAAGCRRSGRSRSPPRHRWRWRRSIAISATIGRAGYRARACADSGARSTSVWIRLNLALPGGPEQQAETAEPDRLGHGARQIVAAEHADAPVDRGDGEHARARPPAARR